MKIAIGNAIMFSTGIAIGLLAAKLLYLIVSSITPFILYWFGLQ